MPYYEKISCRIAVQMCIGHFPDGRERHRTFSLWNVKPDASFEAIADVIRALAPLLAYPITKVRKVVKKEKFFFFEEAVMPVPQDNEEAVMPASQDSEEDAIPVPETPETKIIPFPVSAAQRRSALNSGVMIKRPMNRAILPFESLTARSPPDGMYRTSAA